jgi:hypothetical protein
MEQNYFTASQEIPRIVWYSKAHYRTHERPPTILILSQINPVHTSSSHLLKIQFNITYYLRLFLSGLPTKILYAPFYPQAQ